MNASRAEFLLRLVLRVIGSASLLALGAVVMPYTWMHDIHHLLGLGWLPDAPIVGYLARSLSAFYALFGGLLWMLSFDLARHRPTLRFLGATTMIFGALLLGIDWVEELPRYWRVAEGPFVIVIGAAILGLSSLVKPGAMPSAHK